jgi:hypothetical protein
MVYLTGNFAFDQAQFAAESTRQVAVAAATTQAAALTATKAYMNTVIAAGNANNIQTQAEDQAIIALNNTGAA